MTSLSGGQRIASVDAARGLALAGMVAFHFAWDLNAFGFSTVSPMASPAWRLFGHTVAAMFLFLSGFGLVLARARDKRTVSALRRIGVVAAAALLVSGVTAVAAPGEAVLFGILHCIAVTNLLALPLLDGPTAVVLALAGVAAVAPMLVPGEGWPALWWLGLSSEIPDTLDYQPVLPSLAAVLLGVAFGQRDGASLMARVDAAQNRVGSSLAAAGRHSLAIYLLHQPLMFGLMFAAASLLPRSADPQIRETGARCEAACVDQGADKSLCRSACACVRSRMVLEPGATRETLAAACRPK